MTAASPTGGPRVLFVQHTHPGAYPPIEHAARLLAAAGASVHLIGVALLRGVDVAPHDRLAIDLLPAPRGGWRLHLAFLRFIWRVCVRVVKDRPDWIYASDPLSTPAVWLATRLVRSRCAYHEHDAPEGARGRAAALVQRCRQRLARRADLCIAPSAGRATILRQATGRSDIEVVWNTPVLAEVAGARTPRPGGTRLLYHGSIVPARVPETLLHALAQLPASVSLRLTGYDPSGGGYLARLVALADALGLADRVEVVGVVATRAEVMRQCADGDVGLALLPLASTSVNERTMLGASNKVFDYLACGLAVVVPDLPDWRETFVAAGYGVACDPASVESLVAAIGSLDADPAARQAMGERGRQRILADWHYERSFAAVRARLLSSEAGSR